MHYDFTLVHCVLHNANSMQNIYQADHACLLRITLMF